MSDLRARELVGELAGAAVEAAEPRPGEAILDLGTSAVAEDLPFPDGAFDKVLSVLGAQWAPRHEPAARELARIVRPGGAIVLCNWTSRGFAGELFGTISRHAPTPPAASPWGDEEQTRRLFEGAGVELAAKSRSVVLEDESPESFVALMADCCRPLREARELLEPHGRWADLHADLVALCTRSNRAGDSFRVPCEYLLARGRKERS